MQEEGMMLISATPRRHRGKTRSQSEIERDTPVHGDLIVSQEKSEVFGRYSNVARFQLAGGADKDPLPPLHDVVLSWMGPIGFVLTGIEVIDGVTYAQSWWCRPE
ncbi:hypothetical protein AB6809_29880 [Paraburkholderia sp. RCC_158]|uniref:hypothetical protein n=1 Tax=Paraburkholderia sp. RCC_158 TaxID=3239220 RepID=UPI003524EB21